MIQHIRKSVLKIDFSNIQEQDLFCQMPTSTQSVPEAPEKVVQSQNPSSSLRSNEKMLKGIEQDLVRNQSQPSRLRSLFQRVNPLLSEINKRKKSEVAGYALLNIVRLEFQRKLNEKYEKKLSQNVVNLTDQEDSEMVIKILQKHKPTKREMQFVVQALLTQSIFQQSSNMLLDIIHNMSVFKEFKIESFNPLQAIFNKGELGKKFYILLKGEVFCLITDQQADTLSTPTSSFAKTPVQGTTDSFTSTIKQKGQIDTIQASQDNHIGSTPPSNSSFPINQKDQTTYHELIYLKNKYPLQKITKIYKPGESFGEIALLTRGQRMGTMVCRTEVEVISLTREGFNRIKGAWAESELNKKLSFLRKFSFFKGLSDSRLMSFLHLIEINKYEKNHVLYQKKDKIKYLYFIFEGSVKLFTFIEDSYPIVYNKLCKETIKPEIQKYLKNTKPKLKSVPIVVQGHGSYFGQSEILTNEQERQTMAIIESEQAFIFQIEISKFIDTMKGFNGDYDFIKDFRSKENFQQERVKAIVNTNTTINQTVLTKQLQSQYSDFKRFNDNTQLDGENDNACSIAEDVSTIELIDYVKSDEKIGKNAISPTSSITEFKEKNTQQSPHNSPNQSRKSIKPRNSQIDCSETFFNLTNPSLPRLKSISDIQQKVPQQKRNSGTFKYDDNSLNQIDFIEETKDSNKHVKHAVSLEPQTRKKVNSFQVSAGEGNNLETIRKNQSIDSNHLEQIIRSKTNSIQSYIRSKNSSHLTQSDFSIEKQNSTANYHDQDKLYGTNRERGHHSFFSLNAKNKQSLPDVSPSQSITLTSRKNSSITESSTKNIQQKKPELIEFPKQTGSVNQDYFHSFFKSHVQQMTEEKLQNLQILNYKYLDLKTIGISPQDLIEECRKLQKLGFERGEMTGQMKKTVLSFTNRGLFASPPQSPLNSGRSNYQKLQKNTSQTSQFENSSSFNNKNTEDIDNQSFKNSKLRFLLSNEGSVKYSFDEKDTVKWDDPQLINQITFNKKEGEQTEGNNQQSDTQCPPEENQKVEPQIKQKQQSENNDQSGSRKIQFPKLNEKKMTRQEREELDQQIRKFEQVQRYKNIFLTERKDNEILDIKIKTPRIFPNRERLNHSPLPLPNIKDHSLFQIKQFSLKQQNQVFSENPPFNKKVDIKKEPEQPLQNNTERSIEKTQRSGRDIMQSQDRKVDSKGFVAIAQVRPYYTNHPGQPKNTYVDMQDQLKEYEQLKDYFLTERKYAKQESQTQKHLQNKEQQEIITNLIVSPRQNSFGKKQYDQLKNMHIIRTKLNKHTKHKSLI